MQPYKLPQTNAEKRTEPRRAHARPEKIIRKCFFCTAVCLESFCRAYRGEGANKSLRACPREPSTGRRIFPLLKYALNFGAGPWMDYAPQKALQILLPFPFLLVLFVLFVVYYMCYLLYNKCKKQVHTPIAQEVQEGS